jgi:hypothetical protein
MYYQIISPNRVIISGDTYKEAIKNYVKLNHNLNIRNIIFKDQQANLIYQAKVRYYTTLQQNKVGINIYPYSSYIEPSPIIGFQSVMPNQLIPSILPRPIISYQPTLIPIMRPLYNS